MSVVEGGGYKRYVLAMLTTVYTLNYIDRGLVILLLEPIKRELHLTDTQLGFLTGIAFAIFYATLGIPIARWADRGNRVTLASMAIGLWGVTVMSCMFVVNFFQLLTARIAAAVGESGAMPPTYSLLGDYFQAPAERVRAMGIYWLSNPLSALVSFIIGGWLNEQYGWRATFFIMGLPALLVALLFKLTVREPRALVAKTLSVPPRASMLEVLCALWRQTSTRHLSAAIILLFTVGIGLGQWFGAFLMRIHGMGTAELGVWLGLLLGIGGVIGTLLGGYVPARWMATDESTQMRVCAIMIALLMPCSAAFVLLPGKTAALLALAPWAIVLNSFFGSAFALLQRLVPDGMRATTLAVVMLLANLIGMGLGPQLIGILSDLLAPSLGRDSLRYAMLIVSLVALWSAYHFWQVGATVRQDLARAEGLPLRTGPTEVLKHV